MKLINYSCKRVTAKCPHVKVNKLSRRGQWTSCLDVAWNCLGCPDSQKRMQIYLSGCKKNDTEDCLDCPHTKNNAANATDAGDQKQYIVSCQHQEIIIYHIYRQLRNNECTMLTTAFTTHKLMNCNTQLTIINPGRDQQFTCTPCINDENFAVW